MDIEYGGLGVDVKPLAVRLCWTPAGGAPCEPARSTRGRSRAKVIYPAGSPRMPAMMMRRGMLEPSGGESKKAI